MLILLVSSKTLNTEPPTLKLFSTPQYLDNSVKLIKEWKAYSVQDIQKEMKVSKEIAQLTIKRFSSFKIPHTLSNSKQAIYTFTGSVYKDIEINNYTEADLQFCQKHLRILSGLYGMLKPLDIIQPYRLEMAHTIKYWKKILTLDDNCILNLASKEYSDALDFSDKKVISPMFKEYRDGKLKQITLYVKIARGTMANWVIKNKVTSLDKISTFDSDGYRYNKTLSTEGKPVFVRDRN